MILCCLVDGQEGVPQPLHRVLRSSRWRWLDTHCHHRYIGSMFVQNISNGNIVINFPMYSPYSLKVHIRKMITPPESQISQLEGLKKRGLGNFQCYVFQYLSTLPIIYSDCLFFGVCPARPSWTPRGPSFRSAPPPPYPLLVGWVHRCFSCGCILTLDFCSSIFQM